MPKTNQTLPAFNPADLASEEGKLQFLKRQTFAELYVALPAVVLAFDRAANRAKIQPAINAVTPSEEQIPMPSLANIPVHTAGGGGFAASFPLQEGDTGWLMVCDKDISLFKQNLGVTRPNTLRRHQLEDAFFIPDVLQKIQVAAADNGRAVWQSLDGQNKITLGPADVQITTRNLTINASAGVEINAPQVTMSGQLTVTGLIKGMADIVAGAVSLLSHVHGGVQNGPGVTGGPQ